MNEKKISIIVKSNCDISAITSLMQQTNNYWECFIANNTIKNIEQYIINDKRFKILNNETIKEAISRSSGDYILFIDAQDILTNNAVDNILRIINFTNADIIKFESKLLPEEIPNNPDTKCMFKYIFKKENIMDYVWDNLSEFCFKKDIVSMIDPKQSEHAFLIQTLANAKDMAVTKKTFIIKKQNASISTTDIICNYEQNNKKLSKSFWKEYFKEITPKIVSQTVKNNDKSSFISFCHNIPLYLIPLRYRIICYILKKTNK